MKALYFAEESRRLRYGDNRKIVVGETHTVKAKPKCCELGLHASVRAIDALKSAPGCILYLVELGGDMDKSDDKISAQSRRYIEEFDATKILKEFARKQALININKAEPYFDSKEDYAIVLRWLNSGDERLKESAWSAARSAAESAWSAWSAAVSAESAWSAWSAAVSAESAGSAAVSAESAWSAWSARSAAESARSAANNMLCEMIEKETGWCLDFSKDKANV